MTAIPFESAHVSGETTAKKSGKLSGAMDSVASFVMGAGNGLKLATAKGFGWAAKKLNTVSDNAYTRAAVEHYSEREQMLLRQRTNLKAGAAENDWLDQGRKVMGGAATYGSTVRTMGYTAAALGAIPLALPALAIIAKTGASISDIMFKANTEDTRTLSVEARSAQYAAALNEQRGFRGFVNKAVKAVERRLQSFETKLQSSALKGGKLQRAKEVGAALAARQRAEIELCAGGDGMRLGALAALGLKSVFTVGSTAATAFLAGKLTFDHTIGPKVYDGLQEIADSTRAIRSDAAEVVLRTRHALGDFVFGQSAYAQGTDHLGSIATATTGSIDDLGVLQLHRGSVDDLGTLTPATTGSVDDLGVLALSHDGSTDHLGTLTDTTGSVDHLGVLHVAGDSGPVTHGGSGHAPSGTVALERSHGAASSDHLTDSAVIQSWKTGQGSISQVARSLATEHDVLHTRAEFAAAMSDEDSTFNGVRTNLWTQNDVRPGDTVDIVEEGNDDYHFEVKSAVHHVGAPAVEHPDTVTEPSTPTEPVDAPAPVTEEAPEPSAPVAIPAPVTEVTPEPAALEVEADSVVTESVAVEGTSSHIDADGVPHFTQVQELDVERTITIDQRSHEVTIERSVNGGPVEVTTTPITPGQPIEIEDEVVSQSQELTLRNGEIEAPASVDASAQTEDLPVEFDAAHGAVGPDDVHVETVINELEARDIGPEEWAYVWDAVRTDPQNLMLVIQYEESLLEEGTFGEITNNAIARVFSENFVQGVPQLGGADAQIHDLLNPIEQRTMENGIASLLADATKDDLRTPEAAAQYVAEKLAALKR